MKKLVSFVVISLIFVSFNLLAYSEKSKAIPKVDIRTNDRVISIKGPITYELSDKVCQKLLEFDSQSKTLPIFMFIDSPGGYVDAGQKIIVVMRYVKAPIYGIVVNWCMSMAIFIFNECDYRYAFPESDFLVHNVQLSVWGAPCHVVLKYAQEAWSLTLFMLRDLNKTFKMAEQELVLASSLEWFFSNKTAWDINLIHGEVENLEVMNKDDIKDVFYKEENNNLLELLEKNIEKRHKEKKEKIIFIN